MDSLHPQRSRVTGLVVLTVSGLLLSVAALVTPDPAGLGSHRQLGLAPCAVVTMFGYPCPTCGMTTAYAYAVRGRFVDAFFAQPAGLILALTTMLALSMSLFVLFTGKVWVVNWYRVSPTLVLVAAAVLVLGGWGFKIVYGLWSGLLPIR